MAVAMVASMPLIRAVDDIGVPPVERVDGHQIQQITADELVVADRKGWNAGSRF
jgi:hypothetical protein